METTLPRRIRVLAVFMGHDWREDREAELIRSMSNLEAVKARAFLRADQLLPGDVIADAQGRRLTIAEIHQTPSMVLLDFFEPVVGVNLKPGARVNTISRVDRFMLPSSRCMTAAEFTADMAARESTERRVWTPHPCGPVPPPGVSLADLLG